MGPSLRPHDLSIDAPHLAALARDSKRRIDWDRILVLRDRATGEASPWKWIENARNFAIYTKTEQGVHAVLAVGTVKASANEIAALLTASSTDEYARKMEALHGNDFKDAAHLYGVDPQINGPDSEDSAPARLSVRSLMFATPSGKWRESRDAWCHLDAVYKDRNARCVEKVLTTLRSKDVLARKSKPSGTTTYVGDGVIAAYRIEEQSASVRHSRQPSHHKRNVSTRVVGSTRCRRDSRPHVSSRVHFYAEMLLPSSPEPASKSTSSSVCSHNATKQRLFQVAQNCHRLSLLIRRRRLGAQALVDRAWFRPPTYTSCVCCSTKLLVAKLCRVCGQGVCGDCSDKYERETPNTRTLDTVRVCDPCLDRIELCEFSSRAAGPWAVEARIPAQQVKHQRRAAGPAVAHRCQVARAPRMGDERDPLGTQHRPERG